MRLLADENFNNDILRGLLRAKPDIDILRVQDTEMVGAPDPTLLEWAAQEGRILLTHDVQTMNKFAYQRVAAGLPMPGIFQVHGNMPIGQAIEELLIAIEASDPTEWENRVAHFPIR
jgi:predicted nuclease of predicted toxin-antitoxin system